MTKGIERSSPPSRATSVCPTQAMPRNAAKSRIALTLAPDRNPSMVKEEITISAKRTISPMKALRPCAKTLETLKAKTRIASRTRKAMRLVMVRKSGTDAVTTR